MRDWIFMNTDRIERLSALRDELAEIKTPIYPKQYLPLIKSWISKTTPIIRNDWPRFFDDFQKVTAEPKNSRIVYHDGDFRLSEQEHRRQWMIDNDEAQEIQQNVLGFIDGLLSIPNNPRLSGTFYFMAMAVSVALPLLVFLLTKNIITTGFILFAAVLLFVLIGAFKLKQEKSLSETNFMQLIKLVFEQIPSLIKGLNK
jgi:hypothetical protein